MSANYWPIAVLSALILGVSKSAFGGGPGVVCVPLVASVSNGATAVAVMLPLMMICDVACALLYRRHCVWPLVWRLLGGFVIGVGVATALMIFVPGQQAWLKKVIGGIAIAFALCYFLFLRDKRKIQDVVPQGVWFGIAMGVMAGICSTLAAAAGPPIQMYMLSQSRTQEAREHVGTITMYALIGNWLKVPTYLASGALNYQTLQITWPLVFALPVGLVIGVLIFRLFRMGEHKGRTRLFNDIMNGLLFPIGIFLLVG